MATTTFFCWTPVWKLLIAWNAINRFEFDTICSVSLHSSLILLKIVFHWAETSLTSDRRYLIFVQVAVPVQGDWQVRFSPLCQSIALFLATLWIDLCSCYQYDKSIETTRKCTLLNVTKFCPLKISVANIARCLPRSKRLQALLGLAMKHVLAWTFSFLWVHYNSISFISVLLQGIKKYVVGLIIKTSSDASNMEVSKN